MLYITGMHALNLPCSLNTTGGWHTACFDWGNLTVGDTTGHLLGDWGIETCVISDDETVLIANTLRACVDMLISGDFLNAAGMRDDYICTDEYDDELFVHIDMLRDLPQWQQIDRFMRKEYELKWLHHKVRN